MLFRSPSGVTMKKSLMHEPGVQEKSKSWSCPSESLVTVNIYLSRAGSDTMGREQKEREYKYIFVL